MDFNSTERVVQDIGGPHPVGAGCWCWWYASCALYPICVQGMIQKQADPGLQCGVAGEIKGPRSLS
jgi:hypothetical protein